MVDEYIGVDQEVSHDSNRPGLVLRVAATHQTSSPGPSPRHRGGPQGMRRGPPSPARQVSACLGGAAHPNVSAAPPSSRSGFFWPPYTVHYTAGLCTGSGEWRFWQQRTFLRLGKRDPDDNEVEGEWNHAEEVKRQAFLWIAEEVARDGQAVGKKCG